MTNEEKIEHRKKVISLIEESLVMYEEMVESGRYASSGPSAANSIAQKIIYDLIQEGFITPWRD